MFVCSLGQCFYHFITRQTNIEETTTKSNAESRREQRKKKCRSSMICWKRCDADEVRNGRHKISLSLSWVMTILAIKFCWSVLFGRTSMPIQRSTVGCFIYLLLYWWMQKSCDANSMKKNRNFSHRQRHHNLMKQTHFSHSFQWTHLFTNKWPLIQCYFCHREAVNKKSMYTSGDIEILSTYCMCVLELIFFPREKYVQPSAWYGSNCKHLRMEREKRSLACRYS